jgi:hypothetical protein
MKLALHIAQALPNPDAFVIADQARIARDQIAEAIAGLKAFDRYLDAKHSAMVLRVQGDIPSALKFEAVCDDIYKQLPASVKVW